MLVEAADTRGEWDAVRFCHARNRELRLRYLQRITLGRTYPEMVARTAQVMRSGALASALRYLIGHRAESAHCFSKNAVVAQSFASPDRITPHTETGLTET